MILKQILVKCIVIVHRCGCQLSLLGIIFFITSLFSSLWSLAAPVPEVWKSIDIVYHIDFPRRKIDETATVQGCHRFFLHSGSAVLRCEENISLLRPLHIIKAWQRQQSKVGFFSLTINEFNIKNVHGYIKKIKSISLDTFPVHGQKTEFMTVTGRFIRHVNDVRKYHFRNRATGRISSIWSTPNHPFYVKNRGGFIPIEAISAEDEMVQRDGQVVKLIYPASHGTAGRVKPEKGIVPVYNLEVFGKHTYFVGKDFILVHNPYKDRRKRNKTNRTRISVKDRYKLLFTQGYIQEVTVKEPSGIIYKTLEFRLKAEDKEGFALKYAMSAGKDTKTKIVTAITDPLHKLGFVPIPQGGQNLPGTRRDIVWRLMDWEKFRRRGGTTGMEHPAFPLSLNSVSELPASNASGPSHFDALPPVPLNSGEPPALSHFDPYPGAPPFSLPPDGYYQPPPSAPCFFPDF